MQKQTTRKELGKGGATLKLSPEGVLTFAVSFSDTDMDLTLKEVPIRVDGTDALEEAKTALNRLEILFKGNVTIFGETGQLTDMIVQLDSKNRRPMVSLDVQVEDVETGEVAYREYLLGVTIGEGVPKSGAVISDSPDEDNLDWDDDTTIEYFMGDEDSGGSLQPEPTVGGTVTAPPKGMEALLKALSEIDSEIVETATSEEEAPSIPEPSSADESEDSSGPDQLISEEDSAISLLEFLLNGEHLELEDGHSIGELVPGTVAVLEAEGSDADKAARLSAWLLSQEAVGDLFLDDDELGGILESW